MVLRIVKVSRTGVNAVVMFRTCVEDVRARGVRVVLGEQQRLQRARALLAAALAPRLLQRHARLARLAGPPLPRAYHATPT